MSNPKRLDALEEISPVLLKGGWIKDDQGEVTGASLVSRDGFPHVTKRKPGESIWTFRRRLQDTCEADLDFMDGLDGTLAEMFKRSSGEGAGDCPLLNSK